MMNQKLLNANLKARLKSTLYISGYLFLVLFFSLFFDSHGILTNTFRDIYLNNFQIFISVFGVLFYLSTIGLVWFISKEITRTFWKEEKVNWKLLATIFFFVSVVFIFFLITKLNLTRILSDKQTWPSHYFVPFTGLFILVTFVGWTIVSNNKIKNKKQSFYFSLVTIITILFFIALYYLAFYRSWLDLFVLILLAMLTDVFGYFVGVLFGKHKLCPKISPKKTIEGFIGGVIISSLVILAIFGLVQLFKATSVLEPFKLVSLANALSYEFLGWQIDSLSNFNVNSNFWIVCFFTLIILSIISVAGDLSFSIFKRSMKIKDFGNILPGHGGILDRLDSISFIFIAYYCLSMLINTIASPTTCFINIINA